MKPKITKYLFLLALPFSLTSCEEEKPITNKEESTVIKNIKNTDDYLKKEDYKSIAYGYIYNIKENLKSYESETNGSVKAKVLFFDYDIKYYSCTYKLGSSFYSKDISTSALMTIKNEFYMADKEKILVSRDLEKYDVYTIDEYKKLSYAPSQYTIMGYVFNDESILKSEVVSDKGEVVSIKYTLDNELATNIVKVDMKNNGGLSSYPNFKKIELTLTLKRNFEPVSYSIYSIYEASKAFIGTSEVTQQAECLFSKVNDSVTIPNEQFLADKLGAEPSRINIDDSEQNIKDELLDAVKKLDFANGVNIGGALSLDLLNSPSILNLDANVAFDVSKLSTEKLYSLLNLYVKAEGDEIFNSILGIAKSFAKDSLGDYANLFDNFKSLEVIYDRNGSIYLIPTNTDNIQPTMIKTKVSDLLDLIIKNVDVYGLISGSQNDLVSFKRVKGGDKNNYQVEVVLNEATITSLKENINAFLEKEESSTLKSLLSYKDFDSFKVIITVNNSTFKSVDLSFNYLKAGSEGEEDTIKELIKLHLEAKNQTYDFDCKIHYAESLFNDFTSITEIKNRLNELINHVYVSRQYLLDLNKVYEEYKALNETQKMFIGTNIESDIECARNSVENLLTFLETYVKYDIKNLTNQDILCLAEAYHKNILSSNLLSAEIGEENYSIISNLADAVDYTSFDGAISKFVGDDETTWGLTEKEIRDIKLIFDIGRFETSIKTRLWMKLMIAGNSLSIDVLEIKINNLYNNL